MKEKEDLENYRQELRKPREHENVEQEQDITIDSITKHNTIDNSPGVNSYEMPLSALKSHD